MRATKATELIGHTPIVELTKIWTNPNVKVFVKLEGANAAGSVKDRPALFMVEDAERTGRLRPGMRILEASSGNTGIALSMIGRIKGYGVTIVTPDTITLERKQLLEFYGAEIVYTEGAAGTKGSIAVAEEMAQDTDTYCWTNQYANPANPLAHYMTTGREILEDVPEITHFVSGLGSGGSLMGNGRRLKEHNADIKLIAVEPHPGSKVHGLRNLEDDAFIPPILDPTFLDGKLLAHSRDAFKMVRLLGEHEGLFVGMSAGAVVHGALKLAERLKEGTIVALLADGGWKYLSTGVWRQDLKGMEDQIETILEITW